MKKLLSLFLTIVFVVSLCACGGKAGVTSSANGGNGSSQSGSLEQSNSQISSVVPSENVFPLTAEQLKNYCIVLPKYNVSNLVVKKIDELVEFIEARFSLKLPVVRDDAEPKKYEIIVDNCNRDGVKAISDYNAYDIYNDGVKLYINGGRNYSVIYAIQLIIDDITDDGDIDAMPSNGQYHNEEQYRLIWTDEFDKGESYNKQFWNDAGFEEPGLGSFYGLTPYRSDSLEHLYIKDGAIHHAAAFDGEYFYGTFMTSKNKVMFTYGFAEISAKLADGEGLWHCFWLWDNETTSGSSNILEFDVMECWSGSQYYVSVIHETVRGELLSNTTGMGSNATHSYVTIDSVWKNNSGLEFWRDQKNDRSPERLMSEHFHTFAVLWDEEKVEYYRDGTCTLSYNYLGTKGEYLYKNPHYIVLSMATGSNKNKAPDNISNDDKSMSGVKRPILDADYWHNGKNIFSIDYVQLFQKDGWYNSIN